MEIQLAIGYLTHGSNGDSMLIYWEPEKNMGDDIEPRNHGDFMWFLNGQNPMGIPMGISNMASIESSIEASG